MFQSLRPHIGNPRTIALLLILTLAAAFLRVYGLSFQSFWFDEVCSWHTASYTSLRDVWQADRAWNMYPPGYGLLLHAVRAVLGESEVALRLPSAIAGIASIPLLFLIGARLYSATEGIVAAGLLALSVFPLYFSQEARPYAVLLCAVLCMALAWTYQVECWMQQRSAPSIANVAGWLAAVVCAYLHYFGLFFVLLAGIVALLLCIPARRGLWRPLAFYGASALAFAPWLPNMLWHLQHQSKGPQNPKPDANFVVSFYQYINAIFSHGQTGSFVAHGIVIALGAIVAINVVRALRELRSNPSAERQKVLAYAVVLLVWLLLPFAFAYVKSTVSASVFTHRNLIISLPAIYLITARAVARLPIPRIALQGAVAALFVAALVRVAVSGYYAAPHKDQLREAVAYVQTHHDPQLKTAVVVYAHLGFTFDYYLKRMPLQADIVAGRVEDVDAVRNLVREAKPDVVWYLCTEPYPDNAFVDFLNTDFAVVEMQQFVRANVFKLFPR